MRDLHLPLENTKSFDMQVDLENDFDNIHGISTVRNEFKDYYPNPVLHQPQGGDYFNRYIFLASTNNPPTNAAPSTSTSIAYGAIIRLQNYSPRYYADQDDTIRDESAMLAAIPPMHNWANVVWAVWQDATKAQAADLRYIFHENLINPSTLRIMEIIEGSQSNEVQKTLKLRWPGHKYRIDSPGGLALLGSSHGVGTAWIYINGRKELGLRKTEDMTVTVFTGQVFEGRDEGRDNYYLLWDLGPRAGD
ncbi:MAG: hypothetical protein Q9207_003098 [Kuettlingeria erythrocarpa]